MRILLLLLMVVAVVSTLLWWAGIASDPDVALSPSPVIAGSSGQKTGDQRGEPVPAATSLGWENSLGLPMQADSQKDIRKILDAVRTARPEHAGVFRNLALNSPDPLVAANALRALARLGGISPSDELASLVNDPRQRVRQDALRAIAASHDSRSTELFISCLNGEERDLRLVAIEALGEIGGTATIEALKDAQKNAGADELEQVLLRHAIRDATGVSEPTRKLQPLRNGGESG